MKIVVIGASGNIGEVVADTLQDREHEVIRATRSTEPALDLEDPKSIEQLFATVGTIDAVVVAAGSIPFKHVTELQRDDYISGFMSKAMTQFDVTRIAFDYVSDDGAITLTSGVLSRQPIATGAAAAAANGAIESFVMSAATETPRGIRLNVVSPDVLANSPHFHPAFPGHRPVSNAEIARAYVLAVEGPVNGQTIIV